jgi:hypothetical protein
MIIRLQFHIIVPCNEINLSSELKVFLKFGFCFHKTYIVSQYLIQQLTVTILETNQQNAKIVTYSRKKIAAIVVAVLVIASVAALASGILTTSQNPSSGENSDQSSSQSWMAIGDYATYQGQATVLSMTVNFNATMEIVDLNETYIQVSTSIGISTPFGDTENTTTTWVNRENMTYQPEGLTLNNTYTTQVTLPNIGTQSCTVYTYSSQGISASYYVDNSIQWPIEMTMTSPTVDGQSYSMDITLVDTNIPGL